MADRIRKVEYFYATVEDKPGTAYQMLAHFKERRLNLRAFTAFPADSGRSQLDFFPEDSDQLRTAAEEAKITLVGPKMAFLIQGEDKAGTLADIHRKLSDAKINVHAANGVCDGRGGYGYVLWVKPKYYEDAAKALGV